MCTRYLHPFCEKRRRNRSAESGALATLLLLFGWDAELLRHVCAKLRVELRITAHLLVVLSQVVLMSTPRHGRYARPWNWQRAWCVPARLGEGLHPAGPLIERTPSASPVVVEFLATIAAAMPHREPSLT